MIFVVSGEGPTDIGCCNNGACECSGQDFMTGPMLLFIDRVAEGVIGYAPLETTPDSFFYVAKQKLVAFLNGIKTNKRNVALPGLSKGKETAYFYKNAYALALITKGIEISAGDNASVAVLFRDNDGTQSSPASLWNYKYFSIKSGFLRAEYDRGVPMLPKPKSEAWLLCSAKQNPYQACDLLENISGNDAAANSVKVQLENALGGDISRQSLVDWISDNPPDLSDGGYGAMPSFVAFKSDLESAIRLAVAL